MSGRNHDDPAMPAGPPILAQVPCLTGHHETPDTVVSIEEDYSAMAPTRCANWSRLGIERPPRLRRTERTTSRTPGL